MRKKLLVFLVAVFSLASIQAFAKVDTLIIAGPSASVSHPFFHLIKNGALEDMAQKVEFKLWRTPAQLKSMIINKSVDFIAVPTNVAANFYNKGIDAKLINVSIWGLLSVLSRDNSIKSIKDLKGKEMLVPFRSDVPDIVLQELIKANGIDVKEDMKFHYNSNIVDTMQMLLAKSVDTALMLEPLSSMALMKDKSLNRSIDIQEAWGEAFKMESKIPQAGIVALSEKAKDETFVKRFLEEYSKSIKWYKENPKVAGELAAKNLPMLNAKAVTKSIPHVRFQSVPIKEAKKNLEFFFKLLEKNNPKTIGNKMPDSKFYF